MKVNNFGIEFELDMKDFSVRFENDLVAENSKSKKFKEISHLYNNEDLIKDSEADAYTFYANIFTEEYKKIFSKYNYTNGITILTPESIEGECVKNSGHYHMLKPNQDNPNMECYEVLVGKAAFILQRSYNFNNEEMNVDKCIVVIAEENEKIIVPPYYGHCVINIGEGPMVFGNLAAPCPLNYDIIDKHEGFFTYVHKVRDTILLVPNENYENLPQIKVIRPKEAEHLGIVFNKSLNECFIENPEKFKYLDNPDEYISEVEAMLGV